LIKFLFLYFNATKVIFFILIKRIFCKYFKKKCKFTIILINYFFYFLIFKYLKHNKKNEEKKVQKNFVDTKNTRIFAPQKEKNKFFCNV